MPHRIALIVASLTAVLGTVPVSAEPTHLLPFWGQAFPAGYVQTEPSCFVRRRVETPSGIRYEWVDRCGPPLRVRG